MTRVAYRSGKAAGATGRPVSWMAHAPDLPAQAAIPLGSTERTFLAFNRFTATNVIRVIALAEPPTPAQIQLALPLLAARHPLLRVHIQLCSGQPCFVAAETPRLALLVHVRRSDQQFAQLLEELLNDRLPLTPGPLLRLHYLYSPEQRKAELLVVGHHSICDGVSINELCHELFSLCSGESSSAPFAVRPALESILPRYSRWLRVQGWGAAMARFALNGLLRRRGDRRRTGTTTRFLSAALTENETKALAERARRERTTITGALMAAVLHALTQDGARSPLLSLSVPVNLRPRATTAQLQSSELGNYTGVAFLLGRSFGSPWRTARVLKERLNKATRNELLLASLALVYETGRFFIRPQTPPSAHALISNSGVVPLRKSYGRTRVLEFYSATSARMLSTDFGFFCNAFDGRLRINLVFLQEAVDVQRAARVLSVVREHLARQLDPPHSESRQLRSTAPASP